MNELIEIYTQVISSIVDYSLILNDKKLDPKYSELLNEK